MKDIQFTKQGNTFVAEFEVNADFNLHIEKSRSGYLYMQQRSTSGKWDSVRNFQAADSDYIIDYDFTALVYPKQIRLVSEYAPTMCVLTSDGDVIEIKSQSKEIEITQNGEMSVTPDDGFAYLSSVKVKTNVPQQGGGESGGGSSSESEWVYFDAINKKEDNDLTSDEEGIVMLCVYFTTLGKAKTGDGVLIMPPGYIDAIKTEPLAMAFDTSFFDVPISMRSGMPLMTMNELCEMGGFRPPLELLRATMLEITKEEFYNLES
jgi:hypothetical protein